MFIVMRGHAAVRKTRHGETLNVRTYGTGEFFGELALLHDTDTDTGFRSASVVANGRCTCVELHKPTFQQFIAHGPTGQLILEARPSPPSIPVFSSSRLEWRRGPFALLG